MSDYPKHQSQLKRCPFCAGEGQDPANPERFGLATPFKDVAFDHARSYRYYFVACLDCGASGPSVSLPPLQSDEAAQAKAQELWDCVGRGRAHA